jgi:hypothetical protein
MARKPEEIPGTQLSSIYFIAPESLNEYHPYYKLTTHRHKQVLGVFLSRVVATLGTRFAVYFLFLSLQMKQMFVYS